MILAQPRALFLLAGLQMWESFSYYGMRSILILFLTGPLLYTDDSAYTLYAVYISLVEIGGVLGGFLADKYFGARKSIYIGAAIIILGHLSMLAISFSHNYLFIALSLIAAGSALFKVNCATLLGEFYQKDDSRLQSGFTIYYCSLNVGAFFAMILCGLVAQSFGWHYGFALAGLGMLIGLGVFIGGRRLLEDKGLSTKQTKSPFAIFLVLLTIPLSLGIIAYSHVSLQWLPLLLLLILLFVTLKSILANKLQKKNILLILGATGLLALFYACEELIGTSLVLFAERVINRDFFGVILPSSSLNSVNPITIIIFGLLLSRFLTNKNQSISQSFKFIAIAFFIMSFAFILLLFGNLAALVGAFALIASAELFIGPVVYALCTKLSPENMRGQTMGIVMLGYSLAGLMSGYLGKYLMISEEGSHATFYSGFTSICIISAAIGLIILVGISIRRNFA